MKRARLFISISLMSVMAMAQPSMLRKGVSVQLVSSPNSMAAPDADQADSLIVAVTRNGSVYLEISRVTPAEISARLKPEFSAKSGRRVYLKADARTVYSTVAEVLAAIRAAGFESAIALTDHPGPAEAGTYRQPYGLEVWLGEPAGAAESRIARIGRAGVADNELKAQARREGVVILRAEAPAEWADLIHAADACRGAGAKVHLSTIANRK